MALLRIRPAVPDPDDVSGKRGPLHIEPAISAFHSLRGTDGCISFEIGSYEGKICFFVRTTRHAAPLVESQLYAQYPDIEIEEMDPLSLEPQQGETVLTADLRLTKHEIFPIKRHPQFDDLLARQTVDSIAGITSTMVRYAEGNMRGHIQILLKPIGKHYRKRVFKFLPLMQKGLSSRFEWYEQLFATVHLARGWRWWAYLPLNVLMGGFRAWFSFVPSFDDLMSETPAEYEENQHEETMKSMRRSHEAEDPVSAAVDKVNRLLFVCNISVSVIASSAKDAVSRHKLEEIAGSFRQFSLPNCNSFKITAVRSRTTLVPEFSATPYILSVEELATIWHFPTALVKTPNIDWVMSRKLEPPVDLPVPSSLTASASPAHSTGSGQAGRGGGRTYDSRRSCFPRTAHQIRHQAGRQASSHVHHRKDRHGQIHTA